MERHTEVLRRGLVRRGHRVTTITTPHPEGASVVTDEWGETRFVPDGAPGAYSREWWWASVDALIHLNQQRPVDVVVSQSGAAFGYLRERARLPEVERLPLVLVTHGSIVNDLEEQLKYLTRRPHSVLRWLVGAAPYVVRDARHLRQAEAITALSPLVRARLCRWLRLDPARVTVIPNGVDVRQCLEAAPQRAATRTCLGIGDGATVILAIGDFVTRKGFHHLLNACAHLTQGRGTPSLAAGALRVVLVGDGGMASELRARAARCDLADRVTFTGRVPHEQILSLLWAADVVAIPSLEEGVPFVLLEAMACARPIVATPVGGIPSIVADGQTALLVPPGQPTALAQALARLIADRALASQLGSRAQARVRAEFDQELMIDRYEAVARDACMDGCTNGCTDTCTRRIGRSTERKEGRQAMKQLLRPYARRVRGKAWALRTYWPAMRAHPVEALHFLVRDPEVDNFTYPIANTFELVAFLATSTEREAERCAGYAAELMEDRELRDLLRAKVRRRPDRKHDVYYGRRVGWYVLTRLFQPALVVETGVHDGLGSAVFLRALERNAAEGHTGRLLAIDVDPASGWLIPDGLRDDLELTIAPSLEVLGGLPSSGRQVDLFLHDSDHRADYESAEYAAVTPSLSPRAVVLSDNAHATSELAAFAARTGRRYAYWHERPLGHFYPGGGLGIAISPAD
jgi:glycosyltransferase involved in cell wall biosynthesis